uniref:DNA-directed RNA polymerase II subunit 7 n=1 Tax=Mimivirus LCMiAC02 TaxID=2506609 RepID=A0A481Z1Y5_9VIRU|nr:MAG: DNA-directed RNA polymerase II subunit 7 [Mimivirus LCMiAC02]
MDDKKDKDKKKTAYINTILNTSIPLPSNYYDNKIYYNLKKILEKKLVGRCYKKYGFIVKIYEMLTYEGGIIDHESLKASAKFNITFSCKLCQPIKNTQIICQVEGINPAIVLVENGPIVVAIPPHKINEDVFFTDTDDNMRYKIGQTSKILKQKDFVKVTISRVAYHNKDDRIRTIGFLDDIATEKEKNIFFQDQYEESKFVDIDEYMKQNINIV